MDDQNRGDVIAAVTTWLDHGVATPEALRKEMDTIVPVTREDVRRNPALRGQVQDIAHRLKRLSITLESIARATKDAYIEFGAVCKNVGLASIPDEILAMIFNLVLAYVNGVEKSVSRTWRAAVKLSHVNQQFRAVLLDCPQFWTNMNSCREMVKSCFPRTKGLPLKVNLNFFHCVELGECLFDPVLAELLPLAKHWGRLGILVRRLEFRAWKLKCSTGKTLRHFDAPLLEELALHLHTNPGYLDPPSLNLDCSRWNCPSLRSIKAFNSFPLNLPSLSSVTDLYVALKVDEENIPEIFGEIKKMQNLQNLGLEIANILHHSDIVVYERFEFSQVKHLRVITELHMQNNDISPMLKRSIFSSLFFPGATEFVLELTGDDFPASYDEDEDWNQLRIRDYYFNGEINRIFRHVDQFPLVEVFSLKICLQLRDHCDSAGRSEVYVPLNMLPSLKHWHLILDSNARFEIKEPEVPDEAYTAEEELVARRVAGNAFPILDSITLCAQEPGILAELVGEYLLEVKRHGGWTGLFELHIKDVNTSGRDQVPVSYVGTEVLDWCEDMVNRDATERD
ncbi:hypothetical protein SCHPADRAFT_1001189 [Schizopora paradoxa]|uniref:F-box domain-containing protein n=1 Tax=Schizopora paradoxa TaxID=27342 RepID=A0A0H2REX8_9AGAM|nr:hypothetical protein SCHPADRAFT_1001189 [Schizopora paradoxa]